jgi:eukaryotic-like serine/threonine-protein kinase
MVARTSPCDAGRLKSFLDDNLPDQEQARFSDHLESCSHCQQALESLAAGSRLWGELRQLPPRLGNHSGNGGSVPGTAVLESPGRPERRSGHDHVLGFLASSDEPGSLGRLGSYEVTEVLGHGGFGVVLKAFDPALGRAVAIKVLAPQLATSAAARGRFAREARAAAAVVHENVVAIHSVDSWKNLPYLVMRYIAGQSLQERVDRDGPMDLKAILRVGIQTAQGLASAHAQGLVHRDVKPSNILLENGVERVKLTDFGLARAVDDASLTQSGVVAGTPQYMSPEQARGEAVDHRSDLFSLGSVFYFMCTGHAPFRASSTPAVLRRVSDEEPRSVRESNPDVPVWLAAIIECLHAKEPAKRFGSAREVAVVLEQVLAAVQQGLPVTARPPAKRTRATLSRPGRRTAIAAVLSISACALAVAAYERKTGVFEPVWTLSPATVGDDQRVAVGEGQAQQRVTINESSQSKTIVGSGKMATKSWDVADFGRVQIRSTFHTKISKGRAFKVTTTTDDNVLPYVEVEKDGNLLKVGLKKNQSYKLEKSPEAEIVLPALVGVDVSGASKGHLEGFDSEKDVAVHLSGASKLDGSLRSEKAKLETSGASSLTLTGGAQAAEVTGSGASHLLLGEFPLKQGKVDLSGASTADIVVQSTAPFAVTMSGASKLRGKLETALLTLKTEGACHVNVDGSAKRAKVSVSGASHLQLDGVKTEAMNITVSGASHAKVAVSESLDYDVSSVSHLTYKGNPAHVEGKRTGGSHVSHE